MGDVQPSQVILSELFPTYECNSFHRVQLTLPHGPKDIVHVNKNFLLERGGDRKGEGEGSRETEIHAHT